MKYLIIIILLSSQADALIAPKFRYGNRVVLLTTKSLTAKELFYSCDKVKVFTVHSVQIDKDRYLNNVYSYRLEALDAQDKVPTARCIYDLIDVPEDNLELSK